MRLSEEGWMLLGCAMGLIILFAAITASIIIGVAGQNRINLIVGNGIYIQNQGGGHYFLKNGNKTTARGIGTFVTNINMSLPIGECYKLSINQTDAASFTINLYKAPGGICETT